MPKKPMKLTIGATPTQEAAGAKQGGTEWVFGSGAKWVVSSWDVFEL